MLVGHFAKVSYKTIKLAQLSISPDHKGFITTYQFITRPSYIALFNWTCLVVCVLKITGCLLVLSPLSGYMLLKEAIN